jgi:predicted transcriptional regulator
MNFTKFRESIHSKSYSMLRETLLAKRNELGLSQRELAKKLEVPHSFICKIETGDRRLDVIEFIKYCKALKTNPNNIIDDVQNQI